MQLLKLTHNCLNFDFIGTSTDESSDDLCTVQIPTSWRSGRGPSCSGFLSCIKGLQLYASLDHCRLSLSHIVQAFTKLGPWEAFAFGLAQPMEGVLKNLLQFGQFCKLPKWVHRNNHDNIRKMGKMCANILENCCDHYREKIMSFNY